MKSIISSTPIWLNTSVRMFPILFFQFYLGLTVFVFAFGPWPWPVPEPLFLYSFLLSAHLALWFGYKSGLRVQPGGYYGYGRWTVSRIIRFSLILNLIWIIPGYMAKLNLTTPDIGQILSAIWQGINDPGAAYHSKLLQLEDRTGTPLGYVSILISPVLWMLLPLSIVYWKNLSKHYRYAFILITICKFFQWVAIGTTKGIADLTFLIVAMLIASNPHFLAKRKLTKIKLRIVIITTVLLALLFVYFQEMQYGRSGSRHIDLYSEGAGIAVSQDNWMLFFQSEAGIAAISSVSSYMVQGYYGLSLALQENFNWSYGVGNSFFFTGIFERFVGRGAIFDRTYPARVEEYGWGAYNNWHTFYTWIASDVTFPGAIVVVFIIGKLFAMTWISTLKRENPFAIALFALFVIMLMYFPANNQVLAFPDTGPAFIAIIVGWLFTRKRHKK